MRPKGLTRVTRNNSSGPSQTYPQRAYRNPLDRLVAFLDSRHGEEGWTIWEFRAEGTGYPDEAVRGRVRHYPWPDHHPPPFALVPMIVASMRNWLLEGEQHDDDHEGKEDEGGNKKKLTIKKKKNKTDRVIVVHCKAGKGRSGTMACSFLIAECGWSAGDALARFTERRMRPGFGKGVSIPSQLRWIGYVDRWTRHGKKKYVDRAVEIVEIHVWGLRNGVKVSVEGFADEGKKIRVLHTFTREERIVVEGGAPGGGGVVDMVADMYSPSREEGPAGGILDGEEKTLPRRSKSKTLRHARTSRLIDRMSRSRSKSPSSSSSSSNNDKHKHHPPQKSKTIAMAADSTAPTSTNPPPPAPSASSSGLITPRVQSQTDLPGGTAGSSPTLADSSEPGGQAVIFKPAAPVRVANSDVNVSVERRNRAPASIMGMMTMVTAVAHVWFNAYFEGNGPEQDGRADESGVFEMEWEKMDGIKGSSRKGTRAFDRIAVVWRAARGVGEEEEEGSGEEEEEEAEGRKGKGGLPYLGPGIVIDEPGVDSPVPQMRPADWKGEDEGDPDAGKGLGLRAEEPDSAAVSKASSVKSAESEAEDEVKDADEESDSLKGVKTSGPEGEEELDDADVGGTSDAPNGGQKDKADVVAQKGFVVE